MAQRRPMGALEDQVIEYLWAVGAPVAANEVHKAVGPELAYTTITTVLTRLWEKGRVQRTSTGRCYEYSAAATEAEHPGERVRLRLVNASNGRVYAPRFGELEAELIAVDGPYTRTPLPADGFELAPGNRIDVDLVIPDEPGAFEITDDFTGDVYILGTIDASGDPVVTPDFVAPTNPSLPRWTDAVKVGVDQDYRLNIRRGDGKWEWTMNDRAYPDAETLDIERGSFTKIRLTNESQLLHPIHLHGQFFKVVSRNGESVDEGHFRDTVLVFPGDEVEIGLVALDEGTWAMHCHIQEHAGAGMMTFVDVQA